MKEIDFRYDLLPLKNKLFRLALRSTLDSAEAEDITQDTLLRVWSRREYLKNVDSIEAFCMTICRNLALDQQEKKSAQNLSLDAAAVDTTDNALLPDEKMEREEKMAQVQYLFNLLPEKQRTALQLRDIEEKTYKEVAEIMGVTEENVKVLIHRARMTIRQKYEKIEQYGL